MGQVLSFPDGEPLEPDTLPPCDSEMVDLRAWIAERGYVVLPRPRDDDPTPSPD